MLKKILPVISSLAHITLSSMARSETQESADAQIEEAASEDIDATFDVTAQAATKPGAAHDEYWAGVLVHFSKPPQWLNPGSHWDFGNSRLTLRASDGKLLLTDVRNGAVKWSTPAAGKGAILRFQTDSNLVLYNSAGKATWASNTYKVCQNDKPTAGNPILGLQEDSNSSSTAATPPSCMFHTRPSGRQALFFKS